MKGATGALTASTVKVRLMLHNDRSANAGSKRLRRHFRVNIALLRIMLLIGVLGVAAMSALYSPRPALAATRTWTGSAGDTLWNTPGNWNPGIVPVAGDTVVFNAGANPATINVNISIQAINMASGYTGTITQATGVTILLSGEASFNQSAGVFNGGNGTFTCDCSNGFNLTGGVFNATSGNTFISRGFNHSGGTFNPNGGTVILTSTQGGGFGVGPTNTFHNLTLNYTGTNHSLAGGTIVVNGTLRLLTGFPDSGTLKPLGDVIVESSFGPGGDPLGGTPANITFAGDTIVGNANQTLTNNGGASLLGTWTIDKAAGKATLVGNLNLSDGQQLKLTRGILDQGASSNLRTSGLLTIEANGILLNHGTGNLILGDNLTNNGGLVNFNGGGTGCSDPNVADQLQILSSDNATPRTWSGNGTFSLVDVLVDRQAVGATPGTITTFGSSTLSNTTRWLLDAGCPVSITNQPTNQGGCPGGSAGFTVNANGTGLTFAWRKGGVPITAGGNISIVSGANTSTLTINPVSAGDAGSYDVVATSSLGITANSNPATLNLSASPSVTTNPGDAAVCEGGLASFTAAGTGNPAPGVQWQLSTDGGANFNDIGGATSTTLSFTSSAAQSGNKYRAVFTNTCSSAATTPATLTVNTAPAISANPNDAFVCEGALASFTAAGTGSPSPTVQWQVSTDGGANFNDIGGATSTTLSFTPATTDNGNRYRAVFTNLCNSATTNAASLTVNGFALSANSKSFDFDGGSGNVDVITGSTCQWTAVSNNSFIHITSPLSGTGTGNGTVNFMVDPVIAGPRTGTLTIAGKTFTVNQTTPTAADSTISGRIVDTNGNAVAGAVVKLSGTQNRKSITDANGFYQFDNVETNGFYTVTPSRANYSFSPSVRSFSQLGETTEATFNATPNGDNQNPLDTPEYFVRQHYLDFLGREPDEAGFNFWSDQISGCGSDLDCIERKRINVSAAYFFSIEFQQTGYLLYRMYQTAYSNLPGAPVPVRFEEFSVDTQRLGQGVIVNRQGWEQLLENNKVAFANEFVLRPRFASLYAGLSDAEFVAALNRNTGGVLSPAEQDTLSSELSSGSKTRAQVLRAVAENNELARAQFNKAFVLMQYFGYLRRDPDESGYQFWLNKLNQFNGNFEQAEMVKAFIVSGEYRDRFAQ